MNIEDSHVLKNDCFGFSASLLGAMSSVLKFSVDVASSTFFLAA